MKNWVIIKTDNDLPKYTGDYIVTVGINYDGMGMYNEVRTALFQTVGKNWIVHEDHKNTLIGEVVAWQDAPIPYRSE